MILLDRVELCEDAACDLRDSLAARLRAAELLDLVADLRDAFAIGEDTATQEAHVLDALPLFWLGRVVEVENAVIDARLDQEG